LFLKEAVLDALILMLWLSPFDQRGRMLRGLPITTVLYYNHAAGYFLVKVMNEILERILSPLRYAGYVRLANESTIPLKLRRIASEIARSPRIPCAALWKSKRGRGTSGAFCGTIGALPNNCRRTTVNDAFRRALFDQAHQPVENWRPGNLFDRHSECCFQPGNFIHRCH
jgi:hypothetical protein